MEYHAAVCAQVPVDIWSLHNMTLREKRGEYGTDITLGIDAREGMLYGWRQQDDTERFERHVLVQRWAYIV